MGFCFCPSCVSWEPGFGFRQSFGFLPAGLGFGGDPPSGSALRQEVKQHVLTDSCHGQGSWDQTLLPGGALLPVCPLFTAPNHMEPHSPSGPRPSASTRGDIGFEPHCSFERQLEKEGNHTLLAQWTVSLDCYAEASKCNSELKTASPKECVAKGNEQCDNLKQENIRLISLKSCLHLPASNCPTSLLCWSPSVPSSL